MSKETSEIPCPLCGGKHIYTLEVDQEEYMFGRSKSSSAVRVITYERLFTCPVKNEFFQAGIALKEYGNKRISDVRVTGIAEDKPDGNEKPGK